MFIVFMYRCFSLIKEKEKDFKGFSTGLKEYIYNKLFKVFLKEIL